MLQDAVWGKHSRHVLLACLKKNLSHCITVQLLQKVLTGAQILQF